MYALGASSSLAVPAEVPGDHCTQLPLVFEKLHRAECPLETNAGGALGEAGAQQLPLPLQRPQHPLACSEVGTDCRQRQSRSCIAAGCAQRRVLRR